MAEFALVVFFCIVCLGMVPGVIAPGAVTVVSAEMVDQIPSADVIAGLPPDGGKDFNRLIHEKSPYLLQHADNPIDWYPWGDEALETARTEDKMIFLSIGYSACHWCHVMEDVCFSQDDVAELLNRSFVSIKVDKEERPDIDEIYMTATQIITGQGGWPNTLWLTPDAKPFFAGTFFPKEDERGRRGLKSMLKLFEGLWKESRSDVEKQAERLSEAMQTVSSQQWSEFSAMPKRESIDGALREVLATLDTEHGGFRGAPKFPPHGTLSLLSYELSNNANEELLQALTSTLDGMAKGGIYDHLAGGFHRYSVDGEWLVPHFEKMLYDNAQLARAYVDGFLLAGKEKYREVAEQTLDWVLREMTDPSGGFYASLDADSEGEEGKYYLWTKEEITDVLGESDAEFFSSIYGVSPEGNFRDERTGQASGKNILNLKETLNEFSRREGMDFKEVASKASSMREKLLRVREDRIHPKRDDKILTAWNGMMLGSLAYGGHHLQRPDYVEAASKCADFILDNLQTNGFLLRTNNEGAPVRQGYLEDYALLALGLLDLYEANEDKEYLDAATKLADAMLMEFEDKDGGGFYFTSSRHEELLLRMKDPVDKAIPSGNGAAALVLMRLTQLAEDSSASGRYYQAAGAAIGAFAGLMDRAPRAVESILLVSSMYLNYEKESDEDEAEEPRILSIRKDPVLMEVLPREDADLVSGEYAVTFRVTVDEGWHINSQKPLNEFLIATELTVEETQDIESSTIEYPEGKLVSLSFSPEELSVYEGTFDIEARFMIAETISSETPSAKMTLGFQACNDKICARPQEVEFSLPLSAELQL